MIYEIPQSLSLKTCLDIEQKSSTPGVDNNTENNLVFYVPARV